MSNDTDDYIAEHAYPVQLAGYRSIADLETTPPEVVEELTARFGRPETVDRGEVAYWLVPDEAYEAAGGEA